MRKIFTLLTLTTTLFSCDVINNLPTSTSGGLTQQEAALGIKEALDLGISTSVTQLNTVNGFFGDAAYKILLPPEAKKIETTLRSLGFNKMVDNAILQINRGAEDAAGYAKPIFIEAIKNMTIQDAIGLVKNGDTSATHFFRVKTSAKLEAAFYPVIKSSLEKVDATKYYGDLVTTYNNLPTTFKKLNPDLANYVTEKATDAMFSLIAKEEINIRTNFAARTSSVLKKVFGQTW